MARNSTCMSIVCVVVFVGLFSMSKAVAEHPIKLEELRSFVKKGYLNGISVLKDCKITYELEEWRNPDWLGSMGIDQDSELAHYKLEYIRKEEKERLSKNVQSDRFPQELNQFVVFDGSYILDYRSTKGLPDIVQKGRAILSEIPDFRGIGVESPYSTPLDTLGCLTDLPLEDIFSMSNTMINQHLEEIKNLSCYRVNAVVELNRMKYNISYWLCPERSFLPVKLEIREENGKLVSITEITEFLKLTNSQWFPKQVIRHRFTTKKTGEKWQLGTDTYNIKQVELNPTINEEKTFSPSPENLPPGTVLTNNIFGLEYVASEGPVSNERIQQIIKDTLDDIPMGLEPTTNQTAITSGRVKNRTEPAPKPLLCETGIVKPPTIAQTSEKSLTSKQIMIGLGVIMTLVIAAFWKLRERKSVELVSILLVLTVVMPGIQPAKASIKLESWQSCCGAVCVQTVAGLLGAETELAEIRELLQPNSRGETSLAQIVKTVRKMGFYAMGLRIKTGKLEEVSVPMIAHQPPNHFVVLLGLGQNKGVIILDPPSRKRKMAIEELTSQEYWNIVAISRQPLATEGIATSKTGGNSTLPHKQDTSKSYGPLNFDNTLWYFDDIRPGIKKGHTFSFKNISKKVVTISKVRTSCPCVKIKAFTKEIAPDHIGTVEAVFDSTGMLGSISKTIAGIIGDPNAEKKENFFLTVSGEVSRRGDLILKPARVHLPGIVKGSTVSKTITLKRIGYDHLYLKDIKPNTPVVTAKVVKGSGQDAYEAQIQLNIRAEGEIGPFEHNIVFETDFPDNPTATLPVFGNIVSHIKAEPEELFLGLVSGEKPLERIITLKSHTGTPFEIKAVKSNVDNITAEAFPDNKKKNTWKIILTGNTGLPNSILNGKIIAETDDSDAPMIEIPFTGLVTAQK